MVGVKIAHLRSVTYANAFAQNVNTVVIQGDVDSRVAFLVRPYKFPGEFEPSRALFRSGAATFGKQGSQIFIEMLMVGLLVVELSLQIHVINYSVKQSLK